MHFFRCSPLGFNSIEFAVNCLWRLIWSWPLPWSAFYWCTVCTFVHLDNRDAPIHAYSSWSDLHSPDFSWKWKVIQVPWASSVGSSWTVRQQYKQCLRKQNQTVCEATQKEVNIFAGSNFFLPSILCPHTVPLSWAKVASVPFAVKFGFTDYSLWRSSGSVDQILLFQESFYVGTNVFVLHLILLSGTFTYEYQIGSDFFDFPLIFPKEEISASFWVLPDCVGTPGTAGMGVSYFQLQSFCQLGCSKCPDLWKCVLVTSYTTRKLSCFLAALGSLESEPGESSSLPP